MYFFTSSLILRGIELSLPQQQVAMVTSHALSVIIDRLSDVLSTASDVGKRPLELSSRREMTLLIRSLLCSKTAVTHLTDTEIDHLSSLLLQVVN